MTKRATMGATNICPKTKDQNMTVYYGDVYTKNTRKCPGCLWGAHTIRPRRWTHRSTVCRVPAERDILPVFTISRSDRPSARPSRRLYIHLAEVFEDAQLRGRSTLAVICGRRRAAGRQTLIACRAWRYGLTDSRAQRDVAIVKMRAYYARLSAACVHQFPYRRYTRSPTSS